MDYGPVEKLYKTDLAIAGTMGFGGLAIAILADPFGGLALSGLGLIWLKKTEHERYEYYRMNL